MLPTRTSLSLPHSLKTPIGWVTLSLWVFICSSSHRLARSTGLHVFQLSRLFFKTSVLSTFKADPAVNLRRDRAESLEELPKLAAKRRRRFNDSGTPSFLVRA